MSFVRPDAARVLARWRAPLLACAVALIGAWWGLTAVGAIRWIGWVVVALGVAALVAAVQRMRFKSGTDGPGVVQVDEGAIAYFGPLSGGVVARSEMTALTLDRDSVPAHWRLTQPGQADLNIPLTALGADQLFDAFASLPGMRTERMLHEMRGDGGTVVLWQRDGTGTRRIGPAKGLPQSSR